jgi:hypothetical protein
MTTLPRLTASFAPLLLALITVGGSQVGGTAAFAAKVPRAVLKEYFQTGDKPTAPQFSALIDSILNLPDDGNLLGLRAGSDGAAALLAEGTIVDGSLPFGPAEGLSEGAAGHSGFIGLAFEQGGQTHYGYLQLAAGMPGGADPYPMFVTYFVYDDVAGTAVTTAFVPEPSSLALAAGAFLAWGIAAMRRRRPLHVS